MPVVRQGKLNTTGLNVPNPYVQITPPPAVISGIPTNILGIVGVGSWGPVNSPITVSDPASASLAVGPMTNRLRDLTTAVSLCFMQGSNNFRLIRVTDGTDTAASIIAKDTQPTPAAEITFTAKYTGTVGNNITVTVGTGTKANTTKVSVALSGYAPEVFDNIAGTAGALNTAIANAINNGLSGIRGPSNFIVATAGPSTTAVMNAAYTLTGGTDGDGISAGSAMLGQDATPRKGIYALRGTGVKHAYLADNSDNSTWAEELAFGVSEGCEVYLTGPSGEYADISTAATNKATAGIDDWEAKVLLGDWHYFLDSVNGVTRLVSPQHLAAGLKAALSPEESALNKPVFGIIGTQKSQASQVYSDADLGQLDSAGIDVICNPCPGGNFFGVRLGINSSSDAAVNGDNYTTMTNYIPYSINKAIGPFIGRLQTPDEQREAKSSLEHFLQNMQDQGQIQDFKVTLGAANNPQSMVELGYQQALVEVTYLSVIRYFLVDYQGGQTVMIQH